MRKIVKLFLQVMYIDIHNLKKQSRNFCHEIVVFEAGDLTSDRYLLNLSIAIRV